MKKCTAIAISLAALSLSACDTTLSTPLETPPTMSHDFSAAAGKLELASGVAHTAEFTSSNRTTDQGPVTLMLSEDGAEVSVGGEFITSGETDLAAEFMLGREAAQLVKTGGQHGLGPQTIVYIPAVSSQRLAAALLVTGEGGEGTAAILGDPTGSSGTAAQQGSARYAGIARAFIDRKDGIDRDGDGTLDAGLSGFYQGTAEVAVDFETSAIAINGEMLMAARPHDITDRVVISGSGSLGSDGGASGSLRLTDEARMNGGESPSDGALVSGLSSAGEFQGALYGNDAGTFASIFAVEGELGDAAGGLLTIRQD
ncbi:hypothetical protein SAMN04488047_11529 [Tranquillimonas alkanivorans]|uniref:Transferrin-binding protein B C-lobe/N-lobe beta barrel domain-containing protein n=1 Tax=Tranquillimonas alkanivorans TaxID=441119 RepID=A0A1I5TU13_9RHOB|nr:hypothetical protein SAMN04488047_11529 [Tranquillimonas alkanivorans]